MVDGVERSVRQRILESRDAEVGVGQRAPGVLEHLGALVDAEKAGAWVLGEDALSSDARSGAELEDRLRLEVARRTSDLLLEPVVRRKLAADELEVGVGMEVELVAHVLDRTVRRRSPAPRRARR